MSFFALFPGFKQQQKASIQKEFERLAEAENWDRKQTERFRVVCYEDELSGYMSALNLTTKLAQLQHLCVEVGIQAAESITQCEKALKKVNVNIVDLMDARRKGKKVRRFKSYAALRDYTCKTRRFFPRQQAKDEGVKVLLKHMFN